MKRTLYEMFGLPRNADQAQINSAFQALNLRLATAVNRGEPDAVNESILLKEGYGILSDPARRTHYDATLDGNKGRIAFMPEDTKSRSKLGIETMILTVLAGVFGGIVYHQLNKGMEAVRVEHQQAISVKRAQLTAPVAAGPQAAIAAQATDGESQ
jgi:curved DNA-binding protein CbpA